MPDLAMCQNDKCPMNRKCYRYMAIPDPYCQYYSEFKLDETTGECNSFYEIRGRRVRQDLQVPSDQS
jgi:hypothetical protein